ncbi:Asp-tRNA(Asn)/Glu-tRNA(Gln) amidotransferase subunit GatC [Desulfovulcanus sp.]
MSISKENVAKIATLSRLSLEENELDQFTDQLSSILKYMQKLNELETTDVEPLYSPVDQTTVLREDVVEKKFKREELLANAPEDDGQYFIVPRII